MLMELPMARKQARIKGGGDSYLHASAANRPSSGLVSNFSKFSHSVCILRYSP